MNRSPKSALAMAVLSALVLSSAPANAQSAVTEEMAILDEYLAQFDTWRGAEDVWVQLVTDRCHRTGGAEEASSLEPVASADSTNDLMFQHAKWHGERGRLIEPVFTWSDSDPYGIDFLHYHRDLVVSYDDWRAMNGHPRLEPWTPDTPIPESLAYPVAAPCKARTSNEPNISLPTFLTLAGGSEPSPFWGYTALCEIPDPNRLGKTIEASWYHAGVHLAIGGDMADAGLTLRDPVFWPWHTHVQDIYESWQACSDSSNGSDEAKGTPAPSTALFGILAAAWAILRRKQDTA